MALWGGRFTESTDEQVRSFGDSISFDHRLHAADIQGSIAYVSALERAGCITCDERDKLIAGLREVRKEFDDGTFRFQPGDEDIHTAVERRLGELLGSVAGKLHMGRSRNDQVSTDLRLYLLSQITALHEGLTQVQEAIVEKAEAHLEVIMPGYTHLQQAQPLLFSHWLLSFFWKLQRDRDRLADVERRTAVMPLGSGAIAGHPFGIDREALAIDLGFEAVTQNSVDAVSDRDYVVEFLAWAALLQVHLSNLAEDLIIWASREFAFVELHDAYCTGSSLMPQKKNPDTLELMRGKAGRIIGYLVAILSVLKGLPSGYNKDLQEDKEKVFDVIDTLILELSIAAGLIRTLEVNEAQMARALDDMMLATDLADYLVQKGVPFRQSHELAGLTVKRAEALSVPLTELGLDEFQAIHPAFAEDLYQVFDFKRSIGRRCVSGGTAREAVLVQIESAKALLNG